MGPYRPPAYRQVHLSGRTALGQTFDEMLGFSPYMGDVLRLVYHGGGAWLGFYVAFYNGIMNSKGTRTQNPWVTGFGVLIGAGMGIAGILDGISLLQRACGTHPE